MGTKAVPCITSKNLESKTTCHHTKMNRKDIGGGAKIKRRVQENKKRGVGGRGGNSSLPSCTDNRACMQNAGTRIAVGRACKDMKTDSPRLDPCGSLIDDP